MSAGNYRLGDKRKDSARPLSRKAVNQTDAADALSVRVCVAGLAKLLKRVLAESMVAEPQAIGAVSLSEEGRAKMSHQKLLQQMIGVTLVMLLLVGCGVPATTPTAVVIVVTATSQLSDAPTLPIATAAPALTSTPAGSTIIGKIAHTDDAPRITTVIPCLMVGDALCRVQHAWATRISEEGSFEIADIAPGTYTFFYGPDSVTDSRAVWEGRLVHLEDPVKIAHSFGLAAEPVRCRQLGSGEKDQETGMYPATTITDTVWLAPVSLQIDFAGRAHWSSSGLSVSGPGLDEGVAVRVKAEEGEAVNVTLTGWGCGEKPPPMPAPTLTSAPVPTVTPTVAPVTLTPSVVRGVLIDESTGQPVPDERVVLVIVKYDEGGTPVGYEIEFKQGEVLRSARTDETGAFVVEAQPGTYALVSPGGSPLDSIARDAIGTVVIVKVDAGQTVNLGQIWISPLWATDLTD
jgi:hypothetical protein